MAGKESIVYLGGIPIPVRVGESLEDARARYNARVTAAYRRRIRNKFLKGAE